MNNKNIKNKCYINNIYNNCNCNNNLNKYNNPLNCLFEVEHFLCSLTKTCEFMKIYNIFK